MQLSEHKIVKLKLIYSGSLKVAFEIDNELSLIKKIVGYTSNDNVYVICLNRKCEH